MHLITDIQLAYAISLAISALLVSLPFPGKYFRGINTLFHEFSHALATLIFGGQIVRIELFSDTSGVAVTKSRNKIGQFFTSLAGYPGASMLALASVLALTAGKNEWFIWGFVAIALLTLILGVRNIYGIFWVLSFCGGLVFAWLRADVEIVFYLCVFISSLMLSESLLSVLRLAGITFRNPKTHSDAMNLRTITRISVFFWLFLFFLFSVLIFLIALDNIFLVRYHLSNLF